MKKEKLIEKKDLKKYLNLGWEVKEEYQTKVLIGKRG